MTTSMTQLRRDLGQEEKDSCLTKKPYFVALYNLMLYFNDFCEQNYRGC